MAVVRAEMGTGRARDRMQAARDRHGTAPGQHAGAARAECELPGAYPCGRRGAASPRRRAVDRRAHALPWRLQLRCAWRGRRARLERDGLHLSSCHQHQRRSALTMANLQISRVLACRESTTSLSGWTPAILIPNATSSLQRVIGARLRYYNEVRR